MLVISGSFPPGVPPSFCRDLLRRTTVRVVLDIRGPQLIAALACEPFLVKPNRDELADSLAASTIENDALPDSMRSLNERGARWVVVSQGGDDVWMTSRTETFRISPLVCDAVNPIGCGDCLTAGIAAGLTNGFSAKDAVRWGIAAAAENLQQILPARLNPDSVTESFRQIQMKGN